MSQPTEFDAFPISPRQLESLFLEQVVGGDGGINRRFAFAFLGQSSDYYYASQKLDKASLLEVATCLETYIEQLDSHIQVMKVAQARMFMALMHDLNEKI